MKFLVILFCISQVFLCRGQYNERDDEGRKQGLWAKFWEESDNKVLQYRGYFKDDQPVGDFWYYYPSGEVRAIFEYLNPSQAYVTYYFKNKGMMSEGMYRDQQRDSVWINYNEAGLTVSVERYIEGRLNGKKLIFYLEDQLEKGEVLLLSETMYKDSLRNGPYKEFYSTGKAKQSGQFVDDLAHGEWLKYSPEGYKTESIRYKSGILHGWAIRYDKMGLIVNEVLYQGGLVLLGEDLEEFLENCKDRGIDPND